MKCANRSRFTLRQLRIVVGSLMAVVSATLWPGCCTTKEEQVQQTAKDWCMTIRGSQVIPVYPLTEDIQPGDVFLVQVPVDRQQEIYKKLGFLALDNHLARLNPSQTDNYKKGLFIVLEKHGSRHSPSHGSNQPRRILCTQGS